jgi:hypothetical protein
MHLWELRGVAFPYYFFDENCSYHLLKLMEVARPEIRLSDGFPLAVIPVDTVRAAVDVPGLVTDVRYRPSPATELRHAARRLPRDQQRLAAEIAEGERSPTDAAVEALPVADRAAVLSLAYERLSYAFIAGRAPREASQGRARRILVARSRARPAEGRLPEPEPVPVPAVRPDEGHGSAMVALNGGVEDGDGYLELRFRPAFHGLIDPQGGYTKHMQIAFLDTRIRYYPSLDRVRLEELVFVDALSYSPRSEVFRPIAWKLDTGIRSRRIAQPTGSLEEISVWRTGVGVGLAGELPGSVLAYGLGEAVLDVSPSLDDSASFGPALRMGLVGSWPGDRYRAHLFGRVTYFAVGDTDTWVEAGLLQRITLDRHLAAELETTYNRTGGQNWARIAGHLKLFF